MSILLSEIPHLVRQWHPTKNGDLRPSDFKSRSGKHAWWRCPVDPSHEWSAVIQSRVRGNGCPFCSNKRTSPDKSLAVLLPELAAEWHPTKNEELTPDQVVPGSGKRAWWICAKGHVWRTAIENRGKHGQGCPYCGNQRPLPETCLATVAPKVARQWHPTKNGDLTPRNTHAGSKKLIWWRCPRGEDHVWQSTVHHRTVRGQGCPFCSGKQVSRATSLMVVAPQIASQWHPTKNGDLTPHDIVAGSHKSVWWRCKIDPEHEWQAVIHSRVRGNGCPFCSNKRVGLDNSLATLAPDLAAEWHPTKNGKLTPDQVVPGSGKRAWWRCERGHSWQTVIESRGKHGNGCPFCGNQRAAADNCLAALEPKIARQWHPTKNGDLTPRNTLAGSKKLVWWKCRRGEDHVWRATPHHRTVRGQGCPFCSGNQVSQSTSLANRAPELARQWHPTKNGDLTPHDVTAHSNKSVWWHCDAASDHVWQTSVASRRAGRGCPFCANKRVCKSNCLATRMPKLARQWHPTKNGDLTPRDVVPGTSKNLWWLCVAGHAWQSRGHQRVAGRECPYCQLRKTRRATRKRPKRWVQLGSSTE